MRANYFFITLFIIGISITQCTKPSDHYYADFLKAAEIAKPGRVDSLELIPGLNRAILRFRVGPDRRVNKLRVSFTSSLSADITTRFVEITQSDYSSIKEIVMEQLPEATLMANIVSFDAKGDSSTAVQVTGYIYGERYIASLYNRIYQNITTVAGVKQLNFQPESGKPQDSTVFYTLQRTHISYPKIGGGVGMVDISPYTNSVKVPDLATTGTITHYATFKPVRQSIDLFAAPIVSITF